MAFPRSLNRARRIVNSVTLDTTATIYRLSQVADVGGGFTDTYTAVLNVRCSFAQTQITPREAENAVTAQTITVWQFVFPAETDVRQTDRIVCKGRTFEVTSSASGSVEISKRVLCTEIT